MQKDLENATNRLSDGINKMHESNKTRDLVSLIKTQVNEIERRGNIIMKMEESIRLQQQNIQKLQEQNRHLEAMVEDLRTERQKILEEIRELNNKKPSRARARKNKLEEKEGDEAVTDAA